jgi:hypothetical protein
LHWKEKQPGENFFAAASLSFCSLAEENGAGMRYFCAKKGKKQQAGAKRAIDIASNFRI